jgi:hypothetical protein
MIMQGKPTEKGGMRVERPQITVRTKICIVVVAWVLAAIKTIIPFPYVSKPCLLGYKAGCSFAPISTAILIVGAVITYYVAKKKKVI